MNRAFIGVLARKELVRRAHSAPKQFCAFVALLQLRAIAHLHWRQRL
jgi:hypothetical protein